MTDNSAKRFSATGWMVVFVLLLLIVGSARGQEQSPLLRAQALVSRGQYDEAVGVLQEFIGEMKEGTDQQSNLAAAWYLLAKVYYEVGDDTQCDEALLEVFTTLPGFDRDEPNFGLVERVMKVKAQLAGGIQADTLAREQAGIVQAQSSQQPNVTIEMVSIPNGTFNMGSTSSESNEDECPMHTVALSTFQIGKYEVTQGQWKAVMGSNPAHFPKGDNYPVENVSWDDAQAFIQKLNAMTGKRFRLPTEAEWEYACRAGTSGERYGNLDAIAWHSSNSGASTHPVGQKKANAWGLFDMLGNVLEWCQDWYGLYSSDFKAKPAGPTSGSRRVNRGGSWIPIPSTRHMRAARRNSCVPNFRNASLGLRLASDSAGG